LAELKHTAIHDAGATTLAFTGEVDISNARALRTVLLQTLDQSSRLELDLQAVNSMDSSGIATLVEVRNKAEDQGKQFRVTATSDRVRMALKLLCLDTLLMGD
jgi:anti-anti-sigma factor